MFSIENEKVLEDYGFRLANEGKPLGFLNTDGFNPSYDSQPIKNLLDALHSKAVKLVGTEIGASTKWKNILTAVYLLTSTSCYVSTVTKSDDEKDYSAGEVVTTFGTLSNEVLETFSDDYPKHANKIKKLVESLTQNVKLGYLPLVQMTYNKGRSLKFARKHQNLLQSEFMVLPASVVYGYVRGLRTRMYSEVLVINARKTKGAMREFLLTSDNSAVSAVYTDTDVKEMFSNLQSSPPVAPESVGLNFKMVSGLHNLNFLYYELGVPAEEYPKRMLNLARIKNVTGYPQGEPREKLLRRYKRYADIDIDLTIDTVRDTVLSWDLPKISTFMSETLNKMKEASGAVSDNLVEISGKLDFQVKFDKAIDYYSTSYVRTLVDYVLEHPVEFHGFTGKKMSVKDITHKAIAETITSKEQVTDIQDDDLDFGF